MEPTTAITYKQPSTSSQVLAAAGPMLWVAVSYVDPGKWAAVVDTGAKLGFDMALLMLIMNCAAILCQYLSARVAIATGKDLAQICSKEYDSVTCILLGIEAEISMILLDLTMVLGTAYGLNVMFGFDLFNCVFLTGFDVIIFPFLASFLETTKAKFVSVCLASFILVSYFCGVLVSQPESSLSMGRMLDKLSGENAYALMSVLGASIMPHNFYLHSSIVQVQGQTVVSKEALCHYHFFATLCIFSGICLANCMLMNLSASVFYNSGFVSLTLQDALSLLEQVSTSSIASFALLLYMFFSNHLIALTWSIGGRSIAQDLFRLEIPGWLHRATIRIIAIIPALYCVWNLGAEGVYQLLIFTQVAVAILLPSSVVPLFRVASCRSIMGVYKVSQLVEVLASVSFFGMLGLKIVFVMEMIFGGSDWVSGLKQNPVSGVPTLYLILLMAAFASLFLMLLLVTTPLKSATVGLDTEGLRWDEKAATPESSLGRSKPEISEVPFHPEKTAEKQEPALQLDKDITDTPDVSTLCSDLNLPETLLDFDSNLPLTAIRDSKAKIISSMSATHSLSESTDFQETPLIEPGKVIERDFRDTTVLNTEAKDMGEKTSRMEVNLQNDKVDDLSSWEHEELVKDVSARGQSFESDDPISLRSLSSKADDIGSGTGSLSRLAGLGRAARRQLTVTLEEFWGQLFGYHGQATDEAKSKKLDVLIGVDSRMDSKSSVASVKLESNWSKQSSGSVASIDGTGLDSFRSSSIPSSLNQQYSQSTVGSPIAVQQKPSDLSKKMQPQDPYRRNTSFNTVNFGERRYYSMHSPSSFVGYDQQPATIHGYDLSAYQGQIVKEGGSDFPKSRLESEMQNSAPSVISNPTNSYGRPSAQKPLGGLRNFTPPGFHNIPAARNTALKSERHLNDRYSPEIVDHTGNPPDVKKFYSLPDISGLYVPQREFSPSGNSPRHGKSMIYGQSISRPAREQSALSWSGTAFGFNDLSPSKVCRDAFSLQYSSNSGASSLWSRQPYERFGVADNSPPKVPDSSSIMDIEAKLLQSFRSCIMKLLKLEGSEWLFSQNDGADEDIVARVAAREKFLYDVEHSALDRKLSSAMQMNEAEQTKSMSVPNCGEGCVWGVDLIISFGVWSIHRILDLSLIESRPELWGKYTYVLNRLQGIIEPAYSKPRSLPTPCFCLQLPAGYQQKCSPKSDGRLPPPPKLGAGKFTTAAMLLDMIKDVELAISSRKGRTGTAAGDVAFPKGKENLASVLKRYKRRLANKAAFVSPESATLQQRKISSYSQGL